MAYITLQVAVLLCSLNYATCLTCLSNRLRLYYLGQARSTNTLVLSPVLPPLAGVTFNAASAFENLTSKRRYRNIKNSGRLIINGRWQRWGGSTEHEYGR